MLDNVRSMCTLGWSLVSFRSKTKDLADFSSLSQALEIFC